MYAACRLAALVLALVAIGSGCREKKPGSALASPPPPGCPACAQAPGGGALAGEDMLEVSGLAASAIHDGVFYAHNDSGDSARFFALDRTGKALGSFRVKGADAVDWEDMARGPCQGGDAAGGSCLYFADLGDNREVRSDYTVYRVREPSAMGQGQEVTAEALPFRYPDGSHNCETLLVHPVTGILTVVTKVGSGDSAVYEFPMPLAPGQTVTLTKTGVRSALEGSPKFTGGDVHPKGKGILLRTYTHLFFFPMKPEQSVSEALLGTACPVPVIEEDQGEATAFFASGVGYITLGEGKKVRVNVFDCPNL